MNRRLLENSATVTPLGLRFWDLATAREVKDELVVSAYSTDHPDRRIHAYRTWSGRYAFRGVPGWLNFEHGNGDEEFWNEPLPVRPKQVVEVTDPRRSWQPFTFPATRPERGLFSWTCQEPSSVSIPAGAVPLFSAPGRPVPAGMVVIRASLRDPVQDVAAAWAVIEARVEGHLLARGLADERGQVVLLAGYPEPLPAVPASPPVGSPLPFTRQSWPMQFTARYGPLLPVPTIPDLCQALTQPEATLWADAGRTEPFTSAVLQYGQELVLRTHQDASPLRTLSELHITPAGSPP